MKILKIEPYVPTGPTTTQYTYMITYEEPEVTGHKQDRMLCLGSDPYKALMYFLEFRVIVCNQDGTPKLPITITRG